MIQNVVRVLLVEDDEDDMLLTTQLLREIELTRFDVHWVTDYAAALEELCSDRFDVCLADYRLGPHNGVDLVRDASRRGCRVPVILLTGQGGHEVDLAAMNAGAADFLNKGQITAAAMERSIRYTIQHRRAEEQRLGLLREQAARAEAEAANRAKDQFLAILSHELRTPLTAVLMSANALEQEKGIPPASSDLVQIIKRNVELESRLIDDLLDLTRIARGKLEIRREGVDLHQQLKDSIMMCCGTEVAEKRLQVRVEASAEHHHVWGDGARLQQVLWNLIRNAVKFTPEGGLVAVRTRNSEGRGDGPELIVIEVSDTGIGIERDALPKIFNAFEQADRNITRQFGGLGLGLAICRVLVELHGGRISAHSKGRDQGSTFTLELPVAVVPHGHEGMEDQPEELAETSPDRNVSILLVEDHADTANAMTRILNRRGYDVHPASSMAEALRVADKNEFDVLVSDIGLPEGSGLELMRQLLSKGPIKGIALSGFGMEEDVTRSREAGFVEHLTKPIDLGQLEAAIARVAGHGEAEQVSQQPPASSSFNV